MKRIAWILGGIGGGILLLFIALIIASGSNAPSASTSSDSSVSSGRGFAVGRPSTAVLAPMVQDKSSIEISPVPPSPAGGMTAAETDQKVIKTGSLDLAVAQVDEAETKLRALATGAGGYVEHASVNERDDGTRYGSMTLRVPAVAFETTLAEAKKTATLVKSEVTGGQDVTEQYTDLQAQLRNAQAQEQEYLVILKKATSVQDILDVQQYLGNIRGTIESLQGRIKYLSNLTSYSTLSISLSEDTSIQAPTRGFRPLEDVRAAAQALVLFAEALLTLVIWVLVIGVPLAVLAYLGYQLVRLVRFFLRRRRR